MSQAQTAPLDLRDRFVGFAFAAADLLAEIGADRRVMFAAGAFRERFGRDGEAFEGTRFSTLIVPDDHAGLEIALSLLATRGRLTPVMLRLANADRTPMALSGLRLPNRAGVSWLTLARIPAAAAELDSLAAAPLFRQTMEERMLAAEPCQVGMLEIGGWAKLDPERRRALEASIADAMRDAGGTGALAAEMSDGRFGLLSHPAIDMRHLQQRVAGILAAAGTGRPVASTGIPLAADGLGTREAIRAMRFALSRFASSGVAGVREAGFDSGMHGFLTRTEARAGAVRAAIEAGRFRLAFQPVVQISDRSVQHFEALLRPSPIAGHESENTQDFVNFVEAIGLAETLDRAVLARAAETMRDSTAKVAVNVSGLSMQSAPFRDMLLGRIMAEPALRSRLIVEITETADIDDIPAAIATVDRLAEAGVPVCLDDFGAGYAAFRYLKDFKVNYVKIDGSYVRSAHGGARESGFIGAMVELARCVGARSIAEMIETQAQATMMMDLGVQFGQGWLFGKPGALPGRR